MKTALVLSGGGSKGSFQAGVCEELSRNGIAPTIFTGVSVGALNATMGAQGEMGNLWSYWKRVRKEHVYADYDYVRMAWNLLTKGGAFGSHPLVKLIDAWVDPAKILALGHTLSIGATNLNSGEYETFFPNHPEFKKALLASTTIPATVPPVRIGQSMYVDGGVRNVTPIGEALQYKPDRVIIVGTNPRNGPADPIKKVLGSIGIGIIMQSISILVEEGFESDLREYERINDFMRIPGNTHPRYRFIPTLSIFPPYDLGSGMDFDPDLQKWRYLLGMAVAQDALSLT